MIRRLLSVLALCACVGVPASVAFSADCRTAVFDSAWAKKVRDIVAFNHAHPGYVAKHRLDRDMSRETAALKARMRKALDLVCGVDAIASSPEFVIRGEEISIDPFSLVVGATPALELVPSPLTAAIEEQEAAGYDNPERDYPGEAGGYPGAPGGWFGGAGRPLNPILGGQPPVTPIGPTAPTPEPGALLLVATGLAAAAALIRRGR